MLVELVDSRDPRLRQPTFVVPTDHIHTPIIQDVIEVLILKLELDRNAAGIAAPQLGFYHGIFVARLYGEPTVFINPEMNFVSLVTNPSTEECLSLPGVKRRILRARTFGIRALNQEGEEFCYVSRTLREAALLQHELDHLKGVLITDKPEIRRLPRIFG